MFNIEKALIFEKFYHILNGEKKIDKDFKAPTASAQEILDITDQIKCFTKSATVLRACATHYGLTEDMVAYESVSAHTNLVSVIVDRVLSYEYGPYFEKTEDNFTYREIMEVIRRHDLPENQTGDIPDNGTRDEKAKLSTERLYLRMFAEESPSREIDFEKRVKQLQYNMEEKIGFTGKLLYAADKVAAVLMVLCYDSQGLSPILNSRQPGLSKRESNEIRICTQKTLSKAETFCKASEMWTVDYFKIRKLYQYDTTGLITAILIMYTITVNKKWYDWREKDYENNN